MTEEQLIGELEDMGVTVEWRPLQGITRGLYYQRHHLVVVRTGMTMPQRRSVLAHELIHARREDDGPQPSRIEHRVDELAAQLLISAAEYRLAERYHGPLRAALAAELDVTPTIIEAYQRRLMTTR